MSNHQTQLLMEQFYQMRSLFKHHRDNDNNKLRHLDAIILFHLAKKDMSVKEIQKLIHLAPSTCTQILDALVEKDLITRSPSLSDRRSFIVSLSKNGHEYLKEAHKQMMEDFEKTLSVLSDEEKDTLLVILKKLNEHHKTTNCSQMKGKMYA